jgi:hypothetical protein
VPSAAVDRKGTNQQQCLSHGLIGCTSSGFYLGSTGKERKVFCLISFAAEGGAIGKNGDKSPQGSQKDRFEATVVHFWE